MQDSLEVAWTFRDVRQVCQPIAISGQLRNHDSRRLQYDGTDDVFHVNVFESHILAVTQSTAPTVWRRSVSLTDIMGVSASEMFVLPRLTLPKPSSAILGIVYIGSERQGSASHLRSRCLRRYQSRYLVGQYEHGTRTDASSQHLGTVLMIQWQFRFRQHM